jgi:hypothetical protein
MVGDSVHGGVVRGWETGDLGHIPASLAFVLQYVCFMEKSGVVFGLAACSERESGN